MSGTTPLTGILQAPADYHAQAQQCSKAAISLHAWRTDTFWPDRMSQAAGLTSIRRQTIRIPRDNVAVGRESRGSDFGDKLVEEVRKVLNLSSLLLKLDLSDLNHSNQYIVGLALCTLGNIASVEMSRDLFPEIETLLSTSNPYIRRKAALCAMRICRKVPDLQEHFFEKAATLLSDRNHGVLLCGLTLVTSLCEADEAEGGEEGVV
jgi:hypothetical protein